jgi:deferrochelatase/peroxidase EfeB
LSLYADRHQEVELERATARLRVLFAQSGLREIACHDATALPGGKVHFGYKDGIAQPRIAGADEGAPRDMQPASSAGEFLLGKEYVNQCGGNFIGDLPHALCDNASYAAVRVLAQDVQAFDQFIRSTGERFQIDPELVAAKLMGRWRDGSPLVVCPEGPHPGMSAQQINNFDYAPSAEHPTFYDDANGLRCPIGAHIRRLNPRSALVTGKPHSRRLIRRGVPYGPAFDPDQPDQVERGLFGLFICGDLEMQYEFLMRDWVNLDIETRGIQDTRDPILGAQPSKGGKYVIPTGHGSNPIELSVPRFVTTRGSMYTLLPGVGGLRFIASFTPAP